MSAMNDETPKVYMSTHRRFGMTTLQHEKFNEEAAKGTHIELHSKDWVVMSRTRYDRLKSRDQQIALEAQEKEARWFYVNFLDVVDEFKWKEFVDKRRSDLALSHKEEGDKVLCDIPTCSTLHTREKLSKIREGRE